MATSKSDEITWWNALAKKLNGYKGSYRVEFDGENGEQEFLELVKKMVHDHPNVLDIGCADGSFAIEISEHAEKITAVDLSPVMIQMAKKSSENLTNIQFVVADAKHLPFSDNTFDLVISRRGPVSLPEFFEEAVRVVKPGGIIMEITIGERDAVELKQIFNRGQGYDNISKPRYLEIRNRIEKNQSVRLSQMYEYFCPAYYPTIEDIALLLSSTPIIDDFDLISDKEFLETVEQRYTTEKGIVRTYHRLTWIAEKLKD